MPEDPAALHVVGVTGSGRLFHTMRTPTAWTQFVDVLGPVAANQPQLQGSVAEVAAARVINVGPPASPPAVTSEGLLIVVLATTQQQPLFFFRSDTGQWSPAGTGAGINGARRIAAACANQYPFGNTSIQPLARLHLAWTSAGQLLVNSRSAVFPSGGGGNIVDIENSTGITRGAFRIPALAGINTPDQTYTQALVAGLTADGRMYDSIVTSSGGAQVLNDVEAAGAGEIGEFVDVALANANVLGGSFFYGGVTGDGRIVVAARNPVNNSWTTWRNLEEADFVLVGPTGVRVTYRDIAEFGTFERMALATASEGLHILGVTTNGQLFHQLQPGLSLQPIRGQEFRDVETIGVGANVGEFTAVAVA